MDSDVVTFLGIVAVLTITPGADMALLMRHVLAHGRSAAWPTMAGIFTGVTVHVTLCVAGLSVVLRDSAVTYDAVRLAGAAWLTWLGVTTLYGAWRERARRTVTARVDDHGAGDDAPTARSRPRRAVLFRRGLLTNLLNVKIALFYIAFLPQFAAPGDRFVPVALALAAVQAAVGMAWLAGYAVLVDRAGRALESSPRARRLLESATGAALVGFGVRLATATR